PPPSPGAAPTVPPAPSRPPPAPGSPAPASGPPCSPPAPAAGSCMAAWPNSPSRPRPSHQKSAPPPAPTRPPSTTCSPEPGWPPGPDQTQDQELDSIFTASPTQAGLDVLHRTGLRGGRIPGGSRAGAARSAPARGRTTLMPGGPGVASIGRGDPVFVWRPRWVSRGGGDRGWRDAAAARGAGVGPSAGRDSHDLG